MKNRSRKHDFRVTGMTDDGTGRVHVTCATCQEERDIAAPVAEVNAGGGCLRRGSDEPWQRGDLLISQGRYLEQYESALPDGRVVTWNGQYREWDRSELTPHV